MIQQPRISRIRNTDVFPIKSTGGFGSIIPKPPVFVLRFPSCSIQPGSVLPPPRRGVDSTKSKQKLWFENSSDGALGLMFNPRVSAFCPSLNRIIPGYPEISQDFPRLFSSPFRGFVKMPWALALTFPIPNRPFFQKLTAGAFAPAVLPYAWLTPQPPDPAGPGPVPCTRLVLELSHVLRQAELLSHYATASAR